MEFGKIILGVLLLVIAYFYNKMVKPLPAPENDLNQYWGKIGFEDKIDETIRTFEIKFEKEKIEKLRQKLEDSGPFVEPLEGVAFQYGFNSNKLKEILKYWKDDYLTKWDQRLKHLNQFPQFKTKIQGLDIHFIHVKPKVDKDVKVFPILLLHGWPSSVTDFYKIIPLLTKISNKNIAFEVVAPSLPGFGFSEGAARPGLAPDKMAVVLRNLMIRLNYEEFYVQGGDWGGIIGSHMATLFPENVIGLHSNFLKVITPMVVLKTFISSYFPQFFVDDPKYISWVFPQKPMLMDLLQETGYFHIQATKPDTLGIALNGNPTALAAHILERFAKSASKGNTSNVNGGLGEIFSYDELIDNLMFYYMSNCITTSLRIYKENFNPQTMMMSRVPTKVPIAAAYFKHEIYNQFPYLLKDKFLNIVQVSYHEKGGHFASIEVPEVLHQDVIDFVAKVERDNSL